MAAPIDSQPNVILPSLIGATEPVADPAMEEQNRRREKAKVSVVTDWISLEDVLKASSLILHRRTVTISKTPLTDIT